MPRERISSQDPASLIFAGHNLYFELKGNLTDSAVLNIGEAAEIYSIVTCYLKACHKNNQQKDLLFDRGTVLTGQIREGEELKKRK